jgi:hypothetical protein
VSFASAIVGTAERMPLTDVITRTAIQRAVKVCGSTDDSSRRFVSVQTQTLRWNLDGTRLTIE